jgi:hypothetical protein
VGIREATLDLVQKRAYRPSLPIADHHDADDRQDANDREDDEHFDEGVTPG